MKTKVITVILIVSCIAIITTTLFFWSPPAEKELNPSPVDNTLYVQSSLPGKCRAIIISILDDVKSVANEIPCKLQLQLQAGK